MSDGTARVEVVPFADEHLEGCAALLASRQADALAAEALLPASFCEPAATARVLTAARAEGAQGAVGVLADRPVGFMLGAPKVEAVRGRVAWSRYGWHAVAADARPDGAELYRDLYAAVSEAWVAAGHFDHLVVVPAHDGAALAAFAALGFGHEQIHALRETAVDGLPTPPPAGVEIRRAGPDDLDLVLELAEVITRHQARPPAYVPSLPEWRAELPEGYREMLADPTATTLLAMRGERPVGLALLVADPPDHTDAMRPADAVALEIAATRPEERGTGVGLALTVAALVAARDGGATVCTTEWRASNLLSSRFWPRRGFRRIAVRVARHVDARIAWADGR